MAGHFQASCVRRGQGMYTKGKDTHTHTHTKLLTKAKLLRFLTG